MRPTVLSPLQSSALLLATSDAVARRFRWNLDRLSLTRRLAKEEPMSREEAIEHLRAQFGHDRTMRRRLAYRALGDVRLAAMPNTQFDPRKGNRAWRRGVKARAREEARVAAAAQAAANRERIARQTLDEYLRRTRPVPTCDDLSTGY